MFSGRDEEAIKCYISTKLAPDQAKQLQEKADKGDTQAMDNLGQIYGATHSAGEGVAWWRQYAEQGNTHAQYVLARMYEHGDRLSKDYLEAYFWYTVAAKGSTGTDWHVDLAKKMTSDQLAAAKRLAENWPIATLTPLAPSVVPIAPPPGGPAPK